MRFRRDVGEMLWYSRVLTKFLGKILGEADKCEWLRDGLKNVRHLVLDEAGHITKKGALLSGSRLTGWLSRDTSRSWIRSWSFCRSKHWILGFKKNDPFRCPRYQSVERLQQLAAEKLLQKWLGNRSWYLWQGIRVPFANKIHLKKDIGTGSRKVNKKFKNCPVSGCKPSFSQPLWPWILERSVFPWVCTILWNRWIAKWFELWI